ncbi:hypothetical protein KAZ57_01815 [Patescibacteria group bacterium]|nr:hypothetical protein [Patescibacteria group bacterium]
MTLQNFSFQTGRCLNCEEPLPAESTALFCKRCEIIGEVALVGKTPSKASGALKQALSAVKTVSVMTLGQIAYIDPGWIFVTIDDFRNQRFWVASNARAYSSKVREGYLKIKRVATGVIAYKSDLEQWMPEQQYTYEGETEHENVEIKPVRKIW